jgi:hypothetical protein
MKLYTDEGNLDWVFNNTVSKSLTLTNKIMLTQCEASILHSGSH